MPLPLRQVIRGLARYYIAAAADPAQSRLSQLRGHGPIREFELRLSRFVGKRYCLATNSATNALLALALAANLSRKEIITTPKSWPGTWAPFLLLSNKLRYARCDQNGNINPASVEKLIRKSTRALLAVDFNGLPHDSPALRAICSAHNVLYLADAAQSFGRFLPNGAHASSGADALVLSFGPGKPLDCGEGGAILTDREDLYRECVRLCQHPERFRFEFSLVHFTELQPINARIHPLAAVIGLIQLPTLEAATSPPPNCHGL